MYRLIRYRITYYIALLDTGSHISLIEYNKVKKKENIIETPSVIGIIVIVGVTGNTLEMMRN